MTGKHFLRLNSKNKHIDFNIARNKSAVGTDYYIVMINIFKTFSHNEFLHFKNKFKNNRSNVTYRYSSYSQDEWVEQFQKLYNEEIIMDIIK